MGTPHRIHHDMYNASKVLDDPGDGGTITVTQDLQICEMVSAGTETRTLTDPLKAGIRFVLRVLTDGGSIKVSAANGVNVDGDPAIAMDEAGDLVSIISVSHTTGYRWEILVNTSSVVASSTPSSTPSSTASQTPSSTPSQTKSSTPSSTPSQTASSTPSST
jgi:hypothetical protein